MSVETATIECLCRQISTPLQPLVKASSFPLPVELCHCNTCRYTSGGIGGAFIELQAPPDQESLDKCIEYRSSSKASRYFCATCGSHVFFKAWSISKPVQWFAWPGGIEPQSGDEPQAGEEDTIKVVRQAFVNDTIDGGIVGRMVEVARQPAAKGHEMLSTVYADVFDGPIMSTTEMEEMVMKAKAAAEASHLRGEKAEKLLAQCHCGDVRFHITRPHSPTEYSEKVQYYFKQNNTKYLARFCACRSCRAATGFPLQAWTYIPPRNIVSTDGQAIEFGMGEHSLSQLSGIKKFRNGDEVVRSFCGTCGATVFYEHADRAWVVDISVGLLRSDRGCLAEDFLQWEWRDVSYREECRVVELLDGVVGME